MLRLKGRGDLSAEPCSGCDCFGTELRCSSCMVMVHKDHPLHRLQKWNGEYFKFSSLKSLGLQIQLGHALGHTCPKPAILMACMKVLLDFCDCALATTHVQQLLCMSLFPATTTDPKTAATFQLLEKFLLLSLESKVSGYEFYYTLMRRSDNTGINPIKDQYDSFLRMVREWHHLKMPKRSGRAHDPNGINATAEGACAVICPACPQPGKNLPSNWREAPPDKSWLYGLFVAINANFWLKWRVVSKDSVDPSLSNGWGYFVEESAYKAFLNDKSDVSQEKSTCLSHNAVNMVDTKSNRGLAATGLRTIDCARHNMKLLTAVGDLQKGEKYINMDYLFFSALQHMTVDILNILYDIACQWKKNLWHHMTSFPPSMQLNHNNKKITFFMKDALPELSEHEAALDNLEEGLKEEYSEVLSRWKEEVKACERDPSQPNPYEQSVERITLASVRLELAKEEASKIETDGSCALHEDCSPSTLISSGLELEEQQRCLAADKAGLGIHATDTQVGRLLQRSNSLQHQIESWVKVQELYIPMLLLPSHVGRTATYDLKFQTIEWKLQYGEAHDTLRSLRSNLHMQTAVLKYKDQNLHGQGTNTRAHNMLKRIDGRIEAASSQYQDARKVLVVLTPLIKETGWQSSLRLLNCEDIWGMSDLLWGQTEGRHKLSWIWNMRGAHGDELGNDGSMEDMKIEWCKARAHAMRWKEEVELLREEMQRILQFFNWQAMSWDEHGREDTKSGRDASTMGGRDASTKSGRDALMTGRRMHQRRAGGCIN
ncbi:hypothetical protein EDB19DRAFT_1897468 [Suillus lakei]|nr:hypothetical protein EDB19DRAFT_1897468 [Suillus lakei]